MVRSFTPPSEAELLPWDLCIDKEPPEATSSVSMYSKRTRTSGIRGQLYVTKLLSLLYFRAIHDDTIQEFQLATNVDKIGAFSDICFKAQVKGHEMSVTVFIQAEHRENKKQVLKIDLATYFDTYMAIRQHFGRSPRCDWVLEGTFIETDWLFVIFTNANVDYSDASATSGLSAKLNNILDMGGMVKQPNSEDNIEYLTKKTVKDQITSLAEWIVEFIYDDQKFQLMISEELFLRYHVILSQKVLDVSDIQPLERKDAPRFRIASFRKDFFDNKEEHIMLFRGTLYLEVIKLIEATESDILVFLADPTDATRLSKVIAIVTYNNGKLEFDKQSTKTYMPNIKPIDVSQSTVNKAVELAAIEILSSVKFKVPDAFGNKDLTFSGSDDKIERRIRHLALKMKDLLEECKLTSKVVTIDESLGDGFLRLNGGIAGAIGNIFVLDDNTNLMKITDNCETLGTHAKSLYTTLKSEVHNLHEYKFCFKVDKFPKLSFDCSHYEEKMARDFLNKILVYCNQAEENELQEILKNEIEDIQRNQPNYFQAKTDAILWRYYDEIQKWWMRPQHASYLSPRIDLLRLLIDDIIKDPLMSSINLTCTSEIKQHDYTFTEDAVRSLNLQDQHSSTIIVAENCVLTVVKVLQYLKNKDHVVLDLEYIASLPTNDLNALRAELVNTNNEKVLVLVCNKIDSKNEMKTLKNIAEAVKNKTKNIITDQKSLEILIEHKYFPEADKILHDKKFSLTDVCKESQKSIVEHATVVFPGVEIRLDHLVKDWAKPGLTSAGEVDVAGVAAVTDKPTATGSRDSGMEHRGVLVVEREAIRRILRAARSASLLRRGSRVPATSVPVFCMARDVPPTPHPPRPTSSGSMYSKRAVTSGIPGQRYKTKLLSLLYFRAILDDAFQKFQLATNVDNIGVFGDICFKANVRCYDKPVAFFIQAKHRENDKHILKNDLAAYFDSYKKIKQQFDLSNKDLLFRGTFEGTDCLFVIYTTAQVDFGKKSAEGGFHSKLYDLIDTGGTVTYSNNQEEDVAILCNLVIKDQITLLAGRVASFIYDRNEQNFQMMLSDELVLQYHVILAREVFDVSDIKPPHHRIASLRKDFFDNNEEYIMLFRDTLYLEVIKRRKMKPAEIRLYLSEFLGDPTDATQLSKLIGTAVTYNNGQLEFDKQSTKAFRPNMKPMDVSRSTVNKAVELAAKEILSSVKFKVPVAFGNKDLTLRGSDAKIEKRICYLASKMKDLLDKYEASKIVTIDESLEDGFLRLNGGIAGAIGNIFVLDDDTKLMKITDNYKTLGIFAQKLCKKLSDEIKNLHEYIFFVNIDKFPKLLIDSNENEKNLARNFLNKLSFYSEQAEENVVEEMLKNGIQEFQRHYTNYFQVKTDAIYIKYHDEIQDWWMRRGQASYLTRENDLFQKAINNIIKGQLMNLINVTYMSSIKNNYTFTEDAVSSLNLQDEHTTTVIITENSVLTVVKVLQHLKNKNHIVLDLEYILKLPTNDRNALHTELTNMTENNYLIFVFDKIRSIKNKTLENIAKAVHKKKAIIITNNKSLTLVNEYFPKVDNIVLDENISLIHMSEESQKIILENARVIFQGIEVRLGLIVDDKAKAYVKGDILNTITSDETIVVGKLTISETYDEIKHLYVDRRIKNNGDGVSIMVESLNDLSDNVVLVTADPGMGKSTLLTHLSLKTKELNPEVWIVRINLLEYSKEFSKWKQENTVIDTMETLKFLCQVILREQHDGKESNVEFELEEDNGVVYLKQCTGDEWINFELKLFLHLYNKGRMIFLFDGFDEICPHYAKEVLTCIKTVSFPRRKHRKWITSRSYNDVATILQREFGPPHEIDYFTNEEVEKYLETFWDFYLKIEEFYSAQLENVKSFIEYMLASENLGLHNFAMPLHQVCVNAANYLINEIKHKHIPLWTYDKKFDDSYFSKEKEDNFILKFHDHNSHGNPLHLYLAAVFFEDNIKTVDNKMNKWNLEYNAFSFYERFMEKKMRTIRFQETNKMNISNPDIIMKYKKELADFNLELKKLAAYAIFNWQSQLLFTVTDIKEIEETIRFIEKGGEKTGLIYRVVNGIPIFIHMTFTEYFAVEYVCDCLKNENDSEMMIFWMDFVFNVMFSMENLMYIRNILDYRISIDEILMRILESNKDVIFNLIMEQGWIYSNTRSTRVAEGNYWALSDALQQGLHNFKSFFISMLECHLNEINLNDFLKIVEGSRLLLIARKEKNDVMIKCVIDVVRKIDESKLTSVLRDNFSFLSDSTISRCSELSSQDIVELLLEEKDYCLEAFDSTSSEPHNPPVVPENPSIYGLSQRLYASSIPPGPSTSNLCRYSSISDLTSGALTSNLPRRLSTSDLPRQLSTYDLSRSQSKSLPAFKI